MYVTGRLWTMMRAKFQPLTVRKCDTLALTPSSIALPDTLVYGRVQAKTAPMPFLLCTVQPTRVAMRPVDTYGFLPTEKGLIITKKTMMSRTVLTAPCEEKTPMEPPNQPIPPKPLDYIGCC